MTAPWVDRLVEEIEQLVDGLTALQRTDLRLLLEREVEERSWASGEHDWADEETDEETDDP